MCYCFACNYQQAQIKATKKSTALCLSLSLSHSFPKSSFFFFVFWSNHSECPVLLCLPKLFYEVLSLSLSLYLCVTLSSTMILVQKTQFAKVLGHGYWITLCFAEVLEHGYWITLYVLAGICHICIYFVYHIDNYANFFFFFSSKKNYGECQ